MLQVNDPLSDRKCKDKDCLICTTSNKGDCRSSSINYAIDCGDETCEHVYHVRVSVNACQPAK